MRGICWGGVLLVACGLSGTAAGLENGMDYSCFQVGCGHYHTCGHAAGGGQFYGMTPGCCQCPPTACDNAWDGYCEERAKWKAFWYRVGTGAYLDHHGNCGHRGNCTNCQPIPAQHQPMPVYHQPPPTEYQPVVRPLPPVDSNPDDVEQAPLPPVPKPAPEETARPWYLRWMR